MLANGILLFGTVVIIFATIHWPIIHAAAAVNQQCSPKSCKVGLDAKKPACGSDGFSYLNRCHLELSRCHNPNITFVHRGACRAQQPCLSYNKAFPHYKFKPQCRKDGTYASAQCSLDIGYCWCVTPKGVPVPFTSKSYKPDVKHKCNKGMRKATRSSQRRNKNVRPCGREDRAIFTNNLIQSFVIEWSRAHATNKNSIPDKTVLDWKFLSLDYDGNERLDKSEYKELKKLVKQVVKPKRCAKNFAKTCDTNRDQIISRLEWAQCLNRDGMDDAGRAGPADDYGVDDDDEDDPVSLPEYGPNRVLTDGSRFASSSPMEEESSERREDDDTDCKSDRKTALDEGSQLYVPECTSDGRYAKVQCYKSAGYCWCVNEDTGKNIAGTAVKDQVPKCDLIASSSRPMKGCPEDKKTVFLKDLMEYLHSNMVREANGTSMPVSSWRSSKEEQVASWSFIYFDKNKNQFLDKAEWKVFKDIMSTIKNLRRCGKKLPRYCDINKDRHISLTEWLDCLNANRHQEEMTSTTLASVGKNNPLTLLMDD